jgi:hypothetical protein
MSTEAELKEKLEIRLYNLGLNKLDSAMQANAIHTLYLQAGYVRLSRVETEIALSCIDYVQECQIENDVTNSLVAKLRSRLEVKE